MKCFSKGVKDVSWQQYSFFHGHTHHTPMGANTPLAFGFEGAEMVDIRRDWHTHTFTLSYPSDIYKSWQKSACHPGTFQERSSIFMVLLWYWWPSPRSESAGLKVSVISLTPDPFIWKKSVLAKLMSQFGGKVKRHTKRVQEHALWASLTTAFNTLTGKNCV